MMKNLRNEKGLTLVELLATIIISAIVVSLIMGVHITIQKQYNKQKADIGYFLDVTTVAKVITKDIRKAESDKIVITGLNEIEFEWINDVGTTVKHKYDKVGNTVTRTVDGNTADFISEVDIFKFEKEEDPVTNVITKIKFTIKGESENQIETEIYLR